MKFRKVPSTGCLWVCFQQWSCHVIPTFSEKDLTQMVTLRFCFKRWLEKHGCKKATSVVEKLSFVSHLRKPRSDRLRTSGTSLIPTFASPSPTHLIANIMCEVQLRKTITIPPAKLEKQHALDLGLK